MRVGTLVEWGGWIDDKTYSEMTRGFKPESVNLMDCQLVCTFNICHYMYLRSEKKFPNITLANIKDYALYNLNGSPGFYSTNSLRTQLAERLKTVPYEYHQENKSTGMDVSGLLEELANVKNSPVIISVRAEYLYEQMNHKPDSKSPRDHAIIILDVDQTTQIATFFDPMETFILRKGRHNFKREISLPTLADHWKGSRDEPNWAAWLESKSVQTRLEVD